MPQTSKPLNAPACIKGKGTKLPSSIGNIDIKSAASPLKRISVNIWGPARVTLAGGAAYFVTIVNDHSRFLKIFPIAKKSDAFKMTKQGYS